MRPDANKCRRLKTAIAEEVGNIQGMTERYIAEASDYLKTRIPMAVFDPSAGEEPRKVRYSTAPIPDAPYIDLLVDGNVTEQFGGRGCDDQYESLSALGDRRGAIGCNIPGQSIDAGFDVFHRTLQGKAWETKIACAMDLLLKKHTNEYIEMLRTDLPRRAMEQFMYSLQRNVIEGGRYNTSMVNGFVTAQGAFPAIPTGTADLGVFRRLASILRVQGWTGPVQFQISAEAFNQMRLNYKQNNNMEMVVTPQSNETHQLGEDVQVYDWGGLSWVITDRPTRGWLKRNADSTYTLVPVRPTKTRVGTGEGVVVDVNEDYFAGKTWCDGAWHQIFEVSEFVHEKAANRQSFAMPQMAGKGWEKNLFNFEVRMISGAFIPCNVDDFKFFFRLLHAYAFESTYPELMGAVLHAVAPEPIFLNTIPTENSPTGLSQVLPLNPLPLVGNACLDADRSTEGCDTPNSDILPTPTESDPDPTPVVGSLEFWNEGPFETGPGRTLRVYVERVGGVLGAASVHLATVNGTAAAGTDYTAETADLAWADGEAGRKYIDVPITVGPTPSGKTFTVLRSSATGAVWNGATSVTATIDNI